MSSDVKRLSDLVPNYARYYMVSHQEAAYALHELIQELSVEYVDVREDRLSLGKVFWVGRVGESKRSARFYNLSFDGLGKYFDSFINPLSEVDNSLVGCFCASEAELKRIPASVIYFSRKALGELILSARLEVPAFILSDEVLQAEENQGDAGFKQKEQNYISLIINGLFEIIKEVDKAHTEQFLDEESKRRAETIKRRAMGLRSARKNFNPCPAILSLAEAAGVDMPNSPKTLRKYMGDNLPGDAGSPD
ncbi:hypothetical protein IVE04_25765 [Pseudomonas mendocina]|nr:hypothetical protein [Pseudomonas mendocina]UZZ09590.1 hypothetical protein NDO41_19610 [Pseudomonas mendocina]